MSKYLTFDERLEIQKGLKYQIASSLSAANNQRIKAMSLIINMVFVSHDAVHVLITNIDIFIKEC